MTRTGCWVASFGLLLGVALGCNERKADGEPDEPFEVEWVGCIRATEPWKTCAEFCEWDKAVCAPAGCDGHTVRGFWNLGSCDDEWHSELLELGCEDEFMLPEQQQPPPVINVVDCCCDYR